MSYIKKKNLYKIYILILLVILFAMMLISTALGTIRIPLMDVLRIITSKLGFLNRYIDISDIRPSNIFIVLNIRLPRIILASLVGAVLALVGTAYQAIFKNPMADPFVMGASSGAAFGATIAIVIGASQSLWGFGAISFLAFAGALATTILVYNLARVGNKLSTTSILLAGIVMSAVLSSFIRLMMIFNHDNLENIVSWTMGSFNGANWRQIIFVTIPMIIGALFLISLAREMNTIVLGEESAQNIGVNVELTKKLIIVISSFLAACAVSVSGIIGFVGLIVPHLFRLIFGSDHRVLLPVSALGGALFLLISDTLARTSMGLDIMLAIFDTLFTDATGSEVYQVFNEFLLRYSLVGVEIPVGIITSIFGGPFFLYLLRRSRNNKFI
ncbi:FecCD family ABC transporter permease [Natronospora cellulosivora (SeqCode)]